MAKKVTLFKSEFVTGCLDVDLEDIKTSVMDCYANARFMAKDTDDIRAEDVRIPYTREIQRVVKTLEAVWKKEYDKDIELCWQPGDDSDPNSAVWAVVHNHNQSTNLHSHESSDNYQGGAHVSAAFWVHVPENSGDFVFQYKPNPYIVDQHTISPKPGQFAMFDSTLPHYVTRNLSDDYRVVVSMNFRYKN
jgi:hypothetical protein